MYPPSPVPSDACLADGELPFTAFGQFGYGKMDNRVFEQDVYWVDIAGKPHLLAEMPSAYRVNVIAFLHQHKDYYYDSTALREAITLFEHAATGNPAAIWASSELNAVTVTDMSPTDWLESTPLMRQLRRLTPEAPRSFPDEVNSPA